MNPREFVINGRLRVTESQAEHGEWIVHNIVTGQRLSTCIRLVGELADLLKPGPENRSSDMVSPGGRDEAGRG